MSVGSDRNLGLGPGAQTGFGPGPHMGVDYSNTLQHSSNVSNVPMNAFYNSGSSTLPTSATPTGSDVTSYAYHSILNTTKCDVHYIAKL